ncbi:flagellar hook-basal body complex protein FliE [Aestuariispira insulae]|uniref:Flagellar hook-basal body complex protein FliE n=1 Tax=Aestuariispira insulae TaxID=1461337 RepID=A0A3D9HST0_9PROT|nr:flagellar hook-basal body complex protein FliE [Aestuariispira insulae]RED52475.1 flagellar hook-basal body complex protein FliE [Aestuariispira insulae]
MAINPADVAAAYRTNALNAIKGAEPKSSGSVDAGTHFMNMVKDFGQQTIDANRGAEKMSMEAVAGRAELSDVVTAVAHAETTLKTVVTVRDRIISAYQEIMRMPI